MIYGLVWEPFTGRETIPCANWEILNQPKFWLEFGYDAMSRISKTPVEDFLLREPKFLQTVVTLRCNSKENSERHNKIRPKS
jgi:hypothetical protein